MISFLLRFKSNSNSYLSLPNIPRRELLHANSFDITEIDRKGPIEGRKRELHAAGVTNLGFLSTGYFAASPAIMNCVGSPGARYHHALVDVVVVVVVVVFVVVVDN